MERGDRAAACVHVPGYDEAVAHAAEPVLEARDLAVTFPPRRGQGTARAVDGVNLALGSWRGARPDR